MCINAFLRVTIEAGIGWNTATESERQVMKEQAAADWKQFLTHRYEEMKIGIAVINITQLCTMIIYHS